MTTICLWQTTDDPPFQLWKFYLEKVGVSQLRREFDLSVPTSAQCKNEWKYSLNSLISSQVWTAKNISLPLPSVQHIIYLYS